MRLPCVFQKCCEDNYPNCSAKHLHSRNFPADIQNALAAPLGNSHPSRLFAISGVKHNNRQHRQAPGEIAKGLFRGYWAVVLPGRAAGC